MASHTIVAIYDTPAHAELAIADLTAAGIPSSSIQHYSEDGASDVATAGTELTEERPTGGFWAWLSGEDEHVEHHAMYDHSVRSGHTVVTVVGDDMQIDKISRILEEHAPIDIDERAGQFSAAGTTAGATEAAYGSSLSGTTASFGEVAPGAAVGVGAGAKEEVLSLAEETLQVGKRTVEAGATRLRRYTVERPVEEQIRLRDESVNVFRRRVAGAGMVAADAFTDKTIEMRQTTEEAVVAKSAHVVEEVVLQKAVTDRVETIHDTVRKEEVEVIGPTGERPVAKPAAA